MKNIQNTTRNSEYMDIKTSYIRRTLDEIKIKGFNMRENLAELCHDQWSGWMEYLFSKCYETQIEPTLQEPDGEKVFVIPKWAVDRWTRQMKTKYENLPEDEKESDRKEADRFLALIEQNQHGVQQ